MSVRILEGDALTVLRTLESESVQVCVTSPPYYALRDYGVDGQIGLEATPTAFLEALWAVFDEVRRVLKRDGLCFVNLGDSYAGSGKGPTGHNGIGDQEQRQGFTGVSSKSTLKGYTAGSQLKNAILGGGIGVEGLAPKNLMLMPERFAIGMQDRGWWVRSRIAWCKTSAMPESVRDRPTSAWEHIWMFSRSRTYFYDADAVRQPGLGTGSPKFGVGTKGGPSFSGSPRWQMSNAIDGANLRNYWLLGPEPFSGEHYAGFPTELPKRCILAGSRKGDTVLDPFLGSGTTALVADRLGRHAVGIELNPTYAEMARKRIESDAGPLMSEPVEVVAAGTQASLWESAS